MNFFRELKKNSNFKTNNNNIDDDGAKFKCFFFLEKNLKSIKKMMMWTDYNKIILNLEFLWKSVCWRQLFFFRNQNSRSKTTTTTTKTMVVHENLPNIYTGMYVDWNKLILFDYIRSIIISNRSMIEREIMMMTMMMMKRYDQVIIMIFFYFFFSKIIEPIPFFGFS